MKSISSFLHTPHVWGISICCFLLLPISQTPPRVFGQQNWAVEEGDTFAFMVSRKDGSTFFKIGEKKLDANSEFQVKIATLASNATDFNSTITLISGEEQSVISGESWVLPTNLTQDDWETTVLQWYQNKTETVSVKLDKLDLDKAIIIWTTKKSGEEYEVIQQMEFNRSDGLVNCLQFQIKEYGLIRVERKGIALERLGIPWYSLLGLIVVIPLLNNRKKRKLPEEG